MARYCCCCCCCCCCRCDPCSRNAPQEEIEACARRFFQPPQDVWVALGTSAADPIAPAHLRAAVERVQRREQRRLYARPRVAVAVMAFLAAAGAAVLRGGR
ncbi:MAG: hypothetical protein ACK4ZJ_19270 [Allorhizobium sp.]